VVWETPSDAQLEQIFKFHKNKNDANLQARRK